MKAKGKKAEFSPERLARRRKTADLLSGIGLTVIAIGLLVPLFNLLHTEVVADFKWIYTLGAVLFLGARCIDTSDPSEPARIRRMRRMEFWAGVAFAAGAFFWFYDSSRLGSLAGPLAVMRNTILFSLAGAMIQVISSWMIYFAAKKLARGEKKD